MTAAPKLPEGLEPVAWLYYEGEAEALPKPGQDVWRSILLSLSRHEAYRNETPLVRLSDAQAALQALAAEKDSEIARLKEDAARYRWLREQAWFNGALCVVRDPKRSVRLGSDCPFRERLDEAIDSALLAAKEAKQ